MGEEVNVIWPTDEDGPYELIKSKPPYVIIVYGDYEIKIPETWIKEIK